MHENGLINSMCKGARPFAGSAFYLLIMQARVSRNRPHAWLVEQVCCAAFLTHNHSWASATMQLLVDFKRRLVAFNTLWLPHCLPVWYYSERDGQHHTHNLPTFNCTTPSLFLMSMIWICVHCVRQQNHCYHPDQEITKSQTLPFH